MERKKFPELMVLKCACGNCGTHLEFEAEMAGQEIDCPSCSAKTVLLNPDDALPPTAQPVPRWDKTSTRKPITKNLISCKDCGNSVSGNAKQCPTCGAPVPKKRVPFLARCMTLAAWGVGGFLVLVLLMAVLPGTNSPNSDSKKSSQTVNAGIRTSVTELIIENKDSADWEEKTIYLNGMPPWSYRHTIQGLKAGEVIAIPLIQFAKKNGDRFEPLKTAVKEVWIGGGGFDYVCYTFK